MRILIIQIIILVILLFLSAFFSSAETALTTVNRVKIKGLADDGDKRAALVLRICENYQKMLSAVLIGNNIVNLSASSLATVIVTKAFGSYLIGAGTGVLTLLVLIFGELVPKTIATVHSEEISLSYSKVLLFLMKIFTPLVFVINGLADFILKLFHVDKDNRSQMTENELKTYVDVSHKDGVIESGEKEIIYNVFDFSDAVAKDVMIPRIDMSCVSSDATYEEVEKCFKDDMYTRIPVYEENQDNIIGVINIKDLLFVDKSKDFKVKDYLRDAYYTYEYKKTADLMVEMRQNAWNVAFVLDEYGSTVGMITLEDLLEEIVGEIRDEYDSDEEELINDLGGGKYLIEANMKLDDVNDDLHTDLSSEDYDTVGGIMIEKLERIPYNREMVTLDNGITLSARGVTRHRIQKVLLTLNEDKENEQAGDDTAKN